MTLRACPLCGYRYNAPENQTCGKCKGWLGGTAGSVAVAAPAAVRRSVLPGSPREALCYLPVLVGLAWGWPNPIAAAFGLLMGALLIKVLRLDMERFSKGLLLAIVVAAVFFAYLIFLLIFGGIYQLLEPVLQPLVGPLFKH